MKQSAQGPCPKTIEIFKNKSKDRSDFLFKVNTKSKKQALLNWL